MSRVRSCSYFSCKNLDQQIDIKSKNIKFYSFPSNLEMCKQWIEACQNPALLNLKSSTLQSRRYVCSEHFHYFHFINPLVKNKRLKVDAVPLNGPLTKTDNVFKIKSVLKNGEYVFDHDEQYLIFKNMCYKKLKSDKKTMLSATKALITQYQTEILQTLFIHREMACCFEGCSNTRKKNPQLTFFRFPKEKERRYLWMKKCNNSTIQNLSFEELQNRVVCEEHFLPKCFDYSVLASGKTRRSLFKFALPEPAAVIAAMKKEEAARKANSPILPLVAQINRRTSNSSTENSLSKCKDLVSPQRLMNITENMCPLMRPISPPTYSDSDDDSNVPLMPEVTMATYFSDGGIEEGRESENKVNLLQHPPSSPSCHFLQNVCHTTTTTATLTTTTTTTTSTASAATFVTLKTIVPKGVVNTSGSSGKRPFISSHSPDGTINESCTRKYKKILPKNEEKTIETNSPVSSIELSSIVESSEEVVLNLSGLSINKLEKTSKGSPTANTTSLYLDNNLLQTLPAIDSYSRLTKLSLINNQIDSLIWFGRLTSLQVLNLSKNKIVNIEGLWKLTQLTSVNLSENLIQVIRGQTSDLKNKLEHIDISSNKITVIDDLSMLANLKVLLLHKNQIKSLNQSRRNLPASLTKLTLSDNSILNLGDINELSDLGLLKELTLKHNTCTNVLQLVDKQGNWIGPPRPFDHRPYVLTCCPRLIYLDDEPITETEKVKADWLILDGKLKTIHTQKHALLVTYLSEVCPLPVKVQDENRNQEQNVRTELQNHEHVSTNIVPASNMISLNKNIKRNSYKRGSQRKVSTIRAKRKNNDKMMTDTKESETDCSNEFPCKHYVELIEEKAKNYKLQRANESLMDSSEALQHRIQVLETALIENGFNVNEIFVKFEVEEEEEII